MTFVSWHLSIISIRSRSTFLTGFCEENATNMGDSGQLPPVGHIWVKDQVEAETSVSEKRT